MQSGEQTGNNMQEAKIKINTFVSEYKRLFKVEYDLVVDFVKKTRADMKDQKFGKTKNMNYIERRVCEIPETLYASLVEGLNNKELLWFKSKTGHRWFARQFSEFRVVEKI